MMYLLFMGLSVAVIVSLCRWASLTSQAYQAFVPDQSNETKREALIRFRADRKGATKEWCAALDATQPAFTQLSRGAHIWGNMFVVYLTIFVGAFLYSKFFR